MNILLDEISDAGHPLISKLTRMKDVSIYLSLSREDTIRIMREIHPEVVIFKAENGAPPGFVSEISRSYPLAGVYSYSQKLSDNNHIELINFRNSQSIPLAAIVDQ